MNYTLTDRLKVFRAHRCGQSYTKENALDYFLQGHVNLIVL